MAIPLPNPNIDDTKKVDNLTWSSNKIAGELSEAIDEAVESAEVIAFPQFTKIFESTLEADSDTINIPDINVKRAIVFIDFTLTAGATIASRLLFNGDKQTSAFVTRAYDTSRSIIRLTIDVSNGLVISSGFGVGVNGYASSIESITTNSLTNMEATNITDLKVSLSANIPTGSKITVYAY